MPVHAKHKHQRTDGKNDHCQFLAELIQTDLQRCFLFFGGIHHRRNFSNFRLHTGGSH